MTSEIEQLRAANAAGLTGSGTVEASLDALQRVSSADSAATTQARFIASVERALLDAEAFSNRLDEPRALGAMRSFSAT